jgi:hypothetical protein
MADIDPQQVIIDFLSAPNIITSDTPAEGRNGWRTRISQGGMDARAETFRFIKERAIPRRRVHAVTFESEAGMPVLFICSLHQSDDGNWRFVGGAGGGYAGDPIPSQPWANLGGGGGPHTFYAGGRILGGQDIVRVSLTAANGTQLEDTVDDGVVLFLTDEEVQEPLQARLYDHAGNLVSQHQVWGGKS